MLIKLINMPFANVELPSIALTQLRAITEEAFKGKVKVDVHYLNNDFSCYLTTGKYRFISLSGGSNNSGFGDWFFTKAAHPHVPDNTEEYLVRYGALIGMGFLQKNGSFLREKRNGLPAFIDGLIEKYALADADIIGFTSMFMQNAAILAVARRIKELNKDIIVVMGGANCETPMCDEIIANYGNIVDYVFSGTALISFPRLVKCIMSGGMAEAENINGVFTMRNCVNRGEVKVKAQVLITADGEVETVGPVGDELSINECVPLDYDSFLDDFDRSFKDDKTMSPRLLFETSRGCWWGAKAHCTFCGLNGGGMVYRAMKSENAIKMLDDLFDRYGDRVLHYSSVDNILPKEYIKDVFPCLKSRQGISIFYEVRADLTAEEMKILADAGVVVMQPGIESLATSTLKLMKKAITVFNNIRFLQNALLHCIQLHWNLLIGFPGEEEEVYKKYCDELPQLFHLFPPDGVFSVRFDRYSPYYTQADRYQLDLHPLDYYSYIYPISNASMQGLAYYFSDHNYGAEYIALTGKWLKKIEKRVNEWRMGWADISEEKFPKLFFKEIDGQHWVVDSRLEEEKKILLDPDEKRILENLNIKKNIAGLSTEMPELSKDELKERVDRLHRDGLVFHENGTYMNLVFATEPFLKFVNRVF